MTAEKHSFWLMNSVSFSAASLTLLTFTLISSGGFRSFSLYSFLLSVPFSALTLFSQVFYIKAQSIGAVSLNTFLYSCGFIIPTLYGVFYADEKVYLSQAIGSVLLIVVMYIYLLPEKLKFNRIWFMYIVAAMLCSGVLGILQKIHQLSEHSSELDSFLLSSFAICSIVSFTVFASAANKRSKNDTEIMKTRQTLFSIFVGVVSALLNRVNLALVGLLPSMIFYPVFNGGVTLTAGAAAFILYREKMSYRQIACIAAGIGAIALISKLIIF